MELQSTVNWDVESQREFWNKWDTQYLQDEAISPEALRRGNTVISLLEKLPPEKRNILEVGCGNGWLSERLAKLGRITGVDIADEAIQEARQRVLSGAFICGEVVVSLETLSCGGPASVRQEPCRASQERWLSSTHHIPSCSHQLGA